MTRIAIWPMATREPNFAFGALLFALFGWMNLEVLLLKVHAPIGGHALTCTFGLLLSAIACRRYRIWWGPLARSEQACATRRRSGVGQLANGVALAAAGCALGYSMTMGLLATTAILAGVLALIPWCRSSFCRQHCYVAQVLPAAGGLPMLVFAARLRHPIVLSAYTWALWSLAALLLLSILRSRRPGMYSSGLFR